MAVLILDDLNALMHNITLVPDSTNVTTTSDSTNRLTIIGWQQSNNSDNSYGDGIRLIAEHGRAKLGLKFFARGDSAKVISAKTAPFKVTTGQTLIISVDGGANQTITFGSGTITSGAATADQIADTISASLTGAQAINLISDNTNPVQISSDTFGKASTIQVKGGTANTGLGFPTSLSKGSNGVAMGDGQKGLQKGWIVCHDKPNDTTSANRHGHMSFEVTDSQGEMQTRLGIEYDLDNTRITVSSAQFIVNNNPVIVAADPGSPKEYWFASDNSGQPKSRLWLHRVDGTADQDWKLIAVNNEGIPDTLMTGKRLLSSVWMGSSLQFKAGGDISRQIVLVPSASEGNSFTVTGAGISSYMKSDTYQAGARILLRLVYGQTLEHGADSPVAGVSLPFFLKGAINFIVPQEGASIEFHNTGTYWEEVYRTAYDSGLLNCTAGVDIAKGSLVYAHAWDNTNGQPSVKLADHTNINTLAVLGMAAAAYKAGSLVVKVQNNGIVQGLNTSSFTVGTILYAGTAGGFTAVKPANAQPVGVVVQAAVSGAVFVNTAIRPAEKSGVATLSGGTKTVNTPAIKTTDRVRLTVQPGGTYAGNIRVSAIVNLTSFTILSSNNTDTCNIFWEIVS